MFDDRVEITRVALDHAEREAASLYEAIEECCAERAVEGCDACRCRYSQLCGLGEEIDYLTAELRRDERAWCQFGDHLLHTEEERAARTCAACAEVQDAIG